MTSLRMAICLDGVQKGTLLVLFATQILVLSGLDQRLDTLDIGDFYLGVINGGVA
jgi:hypothetical protein